MIKSDFENCVLAALDKFITDYHTFTRIRLFCDYLWNEIEKTNCKNDLQADYKKAKTLFFKNNSRFLHFSQIMFAGSIIDTMWECIEQIREESINNEENKRDTNTTEPQ